jgi:hypothetical protein
VLSVVARQFAEQLSVMASCNGAEIPAAKQKSRISFGSPQQGLIEYAQKMVLWQKPKDNQSRAANRA